MGLVTGYVDEALRPIFESPFPTLLTNGVIAVAARFEKVGPHALGEGEDLLFFQIVPPPATGDLAILLTGGLERRASGDPEA